MLLPWAAIGGSVEKWPFFQMGHMTNVIIQIHSSVSQYDVYKVLLKKNEWKVPFGGVKVDIFGPQAQPMGLVVGFWCFLVLWSFQIYANNTEITLNHNTCVFVWLYYPFGTKSLINSHILLNHYRFLSPMILPSDSASLLSASDSTPTSIIGTVTSIKVFWTFEHQYYVILIKYSKNNSLVVSKPWF
jgi:hypothetical protein